MGHQFQERQVQKRQPSRRSFLTKGIISWLFLIFLPIFYGVLEFLTPISSKAAKILRTLAATINELQKNSAKIVRMGDLTAILVHTQSGEFKAFNAKCTHLGCIVEYRPENGGYFHCNCHGGEYDLNGKNISGPPPKPLTPLKVSLGDNGIIISNS